MPNVPAGGGTLVPDQFPSAPSTPSPAAGVTNVAVAANLSWTAAVDPEGGPIVYDVYLGTALDTLGSPVSVGQSSTTYNPANDFAGDTVYYWKIVARDQAGLETTGPIWSFRTALVAPPPAPNYPPSPIQVGAPASGATGVTPGTVNLEWGGGDDPEGAAVTYTVYFGTANPPTTSVGTTTVKTKAVTTAATTTYYWKVTASDGTNTVTSAVFSFTTAGVANQNPTEPGNPTPANGATGVGVTTDLSWTASTDPESQPIVYDVFFGTANPPPLVSSDQAGVSYDTGTMGYGTTYFYLIRAKDNAGGHKSTGTKSFSTVAQPDAAPTAITLLDPPDGAQAAMGTVALTWGGGSGVAGQSEVTYTVFFGTANPPPSYATGVTQRIYTVNVAQDTTYYWKIRATNAVGSTDSSQRTLYGQATPPPPPPPPPPGGALIWGPDPGQIARAAGFRRRSTSRLYQNAAGTEGYMTQGTQAAVRFGGGPYTSGYIQFDVKLPTAFTPPGGGLHLGGICNHPVSLITRSLGHIWNPTVNEDAGSESPGRHELRLDFGGCRQDGFTTHVYAHQDGLAPHVANMDTKLANALPLGQWVTVRVDWLWVQATGVISGTTKYGAAAGINWSYDTDATYNGGTEGGRPTSAGMRWGYVGNMEGFGNLDQQLSDPNKCIAYRNLAGKLASFGASY